MLKKTIGIKKKRVVTSFANCQRAFENWQKYFTWFVSSVVMDSCDGQLWRAYLSLVIFVVVELAACIFDLHIYLNSKRAVTVVGLAKMFFLS